MIHMKDIESGYKFFAIATLIGLILLGSSPVALAKAASYNNVQISIQTASNLADHFVVSVFNMSGYMIASSQTQYPAASFELPNGRYIITATAERQYDQIYGYNSGQTGYGYSSGAQPPGDVKISDVMPIYYQPPAVEYGYLVEDISSSISLNIRTQNMTSFPTTTITVKALYANGTSVSGAYVSASTVGSYYYWGYGSPIVMWNSTGGNGEASLTIPRAPTIVNVWSWVEIDLPKKDTTVQVMVGGEKVDVTVQWAPMSVGLAGDVLIIPPQTRDTITLHVEQSNYWVQPLRVDGTSSSTGQTTATPSSDSIPAQVYEQQKGNPLLLNYLSSRTYAPATNTVTGNSQAPLTWDNFLVITAVVALLTAAASLFIALRAKRKV
jgi:hypothetical protein